MVRIARWKIDELGAFISFLYLLGTMRTVSLRDLCEVDNFGESLLVSAREADFISSNTTL